MRTSIPKGYILGPMHDIPIHFMAKAVVGEIYKNIGKVCHSIGGVDEDGGSFIWVR